MNSEQKRVAKALEKAIQMEIDGKKFYLDASQRSTNELGRDLFAKLANEEDLHKQKFESIYQMVKKDQAWPEVKFTADGSKHLHTIFAAASAKSEAADPTTTELEAVQTAMTMETETQEFYQSQEQLSTNPMEKQFYHALYRQEYEHHRILLDYYEYLKDPAAWFVDKEHPSMDGG
ncbi:ferritin family protein [Chloroflexota bacterium]